MTELDKLWEGIDWDKVTTIPFITKRIHQIRTESYKLLEELEMVHKVNKSLSDEKEKNRRVCLEMVTEREQKLEAIRHEVSTYPDSMHVGRLKRKLLEVLGE